MVHVAFVVSRLNKGGPNNQLFYICKYLDRSKVKFTVITTTPSNSPNTYHEELQNLGVKVIELNYGKLEGVLKARKDLKRIAKEQKIDVFQSYGFRAEYMVSGLKRFTRITTIRNRPLFNFRIIHGYFKGTVLCYIHIFFIKKFNRIVTCSQTVSDEVKRFNINQNVLITNAVDTSIIPRKNKPDARLALQLEPEAKYYFTLSSKLPGKNIEFLAESFEKHFSGSNKRLLIAGYADETTRNRFSKSNVVIFTGRVSNIFDYYQAANFFISASLSEGMPNGVLEAMAFGTPVILSNISAHKEIFEKTRNEIGIIFKNNNEKDLIQKLEQVEKVDYSTLSQNCINTVKEHFNAKKMSQAYQKLYLEAVKQKQQK